MSDVPDKVTPTTWPEFDEAVEASIKRSIEDYKKDDRSPEDRAIDDAAWDEACGGSSDVLEDLEQPW